MKTILLFIPALVLLSASASAQTPPAPAPKPGVTVAAPKFMPEDIAARELTDVGGRPFRLSDFAGRVYVLNLWATWCGPCRAEIPGLNKVYEAYAARGVEFVGLTTENPEFDGEKVRTFARDLRMKYRLGWLDRETALAVTALGPTGRGRFAIPQTFVVAADGRIVLHVRGYNPRVPDMVRAGVEQALALPNPAPATTAPTPAPAETTRPAAPSATPSPAPAPETLPAPGA
jgi:thiol-disulfide isomerase/thioredoxin